MSDIALETSIIIMLTIVNGAFAMAEIAMVSARKSRLRQWARQGNSRARVALELANTPTRFLSTVQIAITLIGVLSGAFGGATIAQALAAVLGSIPPLAAHAESIALGIVVLGITYLSLVIGELVPKRLALHNPEWLAAAIAGPMRFLSGVALPVVRLLSGSTDAVVRLLHLRPSQEPPVTEEEIRALIEEGTQAGVFQEAERTIVGRVFHLGDQTVSAVMTPRSEVSWLDVSDGPDELQRKVICGVHSAWPVCQADLDHVLGIVEAKDLLARGLNSQAIDFKTCLRQPSFVPESMPALRVLEVFKTSQLSTVLVVDEHGSLQGLVTGNDILRALVSSVPSAKGQTGPQIIKNADGSWLLDGAVAVDRLKEILNIEDLPMEDTASYHTLGGLVMAHLGRVPSTGDHFELGGLRFELAAMDRNRVSKVRIFSVPKGTTP